MCNMLSVQMLLRYAAVLLNVFRAGIGHHSFYVLKFRTNITQIWRLYEHVTGTYNHTI
jgi:hypothetical protein